jgi:putative NIF3 family GTP cyclohydrolase 1 type 2
MEAKKVYARLDSDFIKPGMTDDWAQHMGDVADFLSDNFKQCSMGVVCDNAQEIKRAYSAVFPTPEVMKKVLKGGQDSLLFVHHPSIWDITKAPNVFYQMDRELLTKFRENRISIYNLHTPLDNFGEYSTSVSLALVLGIKPNQAFAPYNGGLAGAFGRTSCKNVTELQKRFAAAVGHNVKLYGYGYPDVKNGIVAVVAGGGNSVDILEEIAGAGVNTFVTGITANNSHSADAHEYAKKHGINVLGGTHYSTEKFACMEMCKYFKKMKLPCKFIEGKPGMLDR